MKQSEEITGIIERLTFHSSENGFSVIQLKLPRTKDLVCAVGSMPGIQAGMTLRCVGHWKNHLVHGRQFEVEKYSIEVPADILGIKKYLGSGLIKGIGKKYADRIVEKFGSETLNVIDSQSDRLSEVTGLGAKRLQKIKEAWHEQKSIRAVMIFLQGHGVSPLFAQKIYRTYGSQSITRVKENPYCLSRDIFGVGFKT
ncbi:MAG: ATP-dependent RecD-like DNA helicase, partial [Parachlamydia sp.]|nr:ATP-dependent RecD-like DNA helicase [Parachlamydia sp.]